MVDALEIESDKIRGIFGMKILIDVQALQTASGTRGMGRYVSGLILSLAQIKTFQVSVLLNDSLPLPCNFLEIKNAVHSVEFFFTSRIAGPIENLQFGSLLYEQAEIIYEAVVKKVQADVLLIGTLFDGAGQPFIVPPVERLKGSCKVVPVVYDFIPLESIYQYLPTRESQMLYKLSMTRLGACDLLFTISDFVKNHCRILFPYIPVQTIWGGVDAIFQCSQDDNNERKDFLLYSGGVDSRKNVLTLLKAYALLKEELRSQYPLVVVCSNSTEAKKTFEKEVRILGIEKNVQFKLYVEDRELRKLYQTCRLFIFPSLCEGLGLPVLEAAACGAAVLTSNNSSLKEIYPEPLALFTAHNVNELSDLISSTLLDQKKIEQLQDFSAKQAKFFTWENTAKLCEEFLTVEGRFQKSTEMSTLTNTANLLSFFTSGKSCEQREAAKALSKIYGRRVYFDISNFVLSQTHTGIQRVVANVLKYLPNFLQSNTELVCIASQPTGGYSVVVFKGGAWVRIRDAEPIANDIYLSIDLTPEDLIKNKSTITQWKLKGVKLFFCVHDIVFELHPEFVVDSIAIERLDLWLRFVLRYADGVLTVSNTVKNELLRWRRENDLDLTNPNLLVEYFHNASDLGIEQLKLIKEKNKKFKFITVSTIEPRKGYIELLDAFAKVGDSLEVELIIVGRPGWKCDDIIEKIKSTKNVIWYSDCSDEKLKKLYSEADCFVFASYYEGFGIAVAEAAQYGLPLLLRDIPVFKEIAGEGAIYFASTEGSLEAQLRRCVLNYESLPSSKSVKPLTWWESTKMLWSRIESMLEKQN